MRPLHARSLTNIYNLFNITERGRRVISNGWKAAGITEAVADAREWDSTIDLERLVAPFANLQI